MYCFRKIHLIILLAFCYIFFTINPVYCEENSLTLGKIKSSFLKNKSKPADKNTPQKGYYGTLPDIEADFKYKQKPKPSANSQNTQIGNGDNLKDENLKKAPYNDPLFLDNIVKQKDTRSQYINDLQKTRLALENLKKCIDENADIQRFNGCINLLDLYSKNLKAKYENQSQSLKESYKQIMRTNYEAKVLGNLMYDSNYYARYIPTQQGKYSKSNIQAEKEKLLIKVNKTLFLIYEEK